MKAICTIECMKPDLSNTTHVFMDLHVLVLGTASGTISLNSCCSVNMTQNLAAIEAAISSKVASLASSHGVTLSSGDLLISGLSEI